MAGEPMLCCCQQKDPVKKAAPKDTDCVVSGHHPGTAYVAESASFLEMNVPRMRRFTAADLGLTVRTTTFWRIRHKGQLS